VVRALHDPRRRLAATHLAEQAARLGPDVAAERCLAVLGERPEQPREVRR
jgi:hypothetical protein